MESEKVKEIKDKLQEEIFITNSFGDKLRKVPTKELENLLTLINELESENERLMKLQARGGCRVAELGIENQQLKDRIAELEKENAIKTDTIADLLKKQEFYEKEKLNKFAEMLKEKCHNYYPSIDHYCCSEKAVDIKDIDETLKNFAEKLNKRRDYD